MASKSLQASALGWILVSVGHTVSAKDWQKDDKFKELSNLAYTCAKAGWFQGSAFFLMTALLNYHWAHNPKSLAMPINKTIAALATAIMWVSSAWYLRRGIKTNGSLTAVMGALQAWAAFRP